MRDLFAHADAVSAVVGRGSRGSLQCADILLSEHLSRRSARRWIAAVWTSHPGCVVAAARQLRGRWCLLAVRGGGVLLVCADRKSTLDCVTTELLARASYIRWILEVSP